MSTGINILGRAPGKKRRSRGHSFIELMVAVAVLGSGLIMVYKGLLSTLDYQKHLTYRSYALNLLDHKMAALQYAFREKNKMPVYEDGEIENIVVNNNNVSFHFKMDYSPLAALTEVYEVTMVLSWRERGRNFKVARCGYISNF